MEAEGSVGAPLVSECLSVQYRCVHKKKSFYRRLFSETAPHCVGTCFLNFYLTGSVTNSHISPVQPQSDQLATEQLELGVKGLAQGRVFSHPDLFSQSSW